MRQTDRHRLQKAIRSGDECELRQAVQNAARFGTRYREIDELVRQTPGGWKYRRHFEIRMGDTTVSNRLGRPIVDHPDDGYCGW